MKVFSTFSGISAASIAWKPLGAQFVGFAEIEPFPCAVLAARCGATRPLYLPDPAEPGISADERKKRASRIKNTQSLPTAGIPNFGDITRITDDDLERLGQIDVLEGGSPCQSFSIAGMRLGLEDSRGNLLFAFCDLARRMRAINGLKFFVWENVKGVLSDATNGFGSLLGFMAGEECALQPPGKKWTNSGHVLGPECDIAWRVFDARFWGVPQRRKRVYVIGDFRDGNADAGAILFKRYGEARNPLAGNQPTEIAPGLPAAGSPCIAFQANAGARARSVGAEIDTSPTLTSSEGGNRVPAVAYSLPGNWIGRRPENGGNAIQPGVDVAPCLTTVDRHGVAYAVQDEFSDVKISEDVAFTLMTASRKQTIVHTPEWVVRRLTPRECERLQGMPDGWTDVEFNGRPAADGHRYKAVGNSMAVPCLAYIGRGIKHELSKEEGP